MKPALPTPDELGSLYGLFKHRLHETPDQCAYLRYEEGIDQWREVTWREVGKWLGRWVSALQKERLSPGDRVGIALRNSIEWVLADQAAMALGLVTVPLFVDDRAESMAYILDHAAVRVLFMSDAAHYKKLKPALSDYHSLQKVVLLKDQSDDTLAVNLADWLSAHTDLTLPADFLRLEDLATIVYTSGTTGKPKGVRLTHQNILSNVHASLQVFECTPGDRLLSFLPLSHMLERTAGYYLPMMAGSCVAHARSIQLLREDMQQTQPTLLIAVPRIFERVYARLEEQLLHASALKRTLFDWTSACGWRRFEATQNGQKPALLDRLLWPVYERLVASKIQNALGGKLRAAFSGGAPLPFCVARRFLSLGVTILQGYGLSETSPVVSVNTPTRNRPTSVGTKLPGLELKLGEENELLVRGPSVMAGYHRNDEATRTAIDEQGWFRTGDQAHIEEGFLTITGRLKDILVLSNGEKVSPGDIESTLKLDPLLEEVVVFGEGKPFIGALVVVNADLWPALAERLGQRPAPERYLVKHCNELLEGFAAHAKIRRVVISTQSWAIESGELTPTLKVKRAVVLERFKEEIETLYA